MDIKKVLKNPSELGRAWLTGVREVYLYENGKRTDTVIGYKYRIVFIDADAETVDFKILGDKLMDDPEGHVEVELVNPEWVPYVMDNHVRIAAKATGIHAVK